MDKLEKVMKGLDCCASGNSCQGKCPYDEMGYEWTDCVRPLARDALYILKKEAPRLLTIEEITGDGECWFEGINGAYGYADCYMCAVNNEIELNRISMKREYVLIDDFMKKWRCWNFRPTDEQRKATPWTS